MRALTDPGCQASLLCLVVELVDVGQAEWPVGLKE